MVGVTDTVFRRFIRHASLFTAGIEGMESQVSESRPGAPEINSAVTNEKSGCGLLMTEFTSADGLARMRETKRQRYLTFYDDEHPIGAQLFGANPETLAEAARIVEETGFDLVDLNLGCPAKRVVGSNAICPAFKRSSAPCARRSPFPSPSSSASAGMTPTLSAWNWRAWPRPRG
jgi:tRNA-dihydrouridine synthase